MLSPSDRQVTHALLTRPPLSFPNFLPKNSFQKFSLDLHVLGTPPAFVLSQDQTLDYIVIFKAFRLFIYSLDRFSALSNTNVFVKFAKNFFLELTRSIPCAIVVTVLLLQATVTASSLFTFQTSSCPCDSLFIISRFLSLVKNFFQELLNSFSRRVFVIPESLVIPSANFSIAWLLCPVVSHKRQLS